MKKTRKVLEQVKLKKKTKKYKALDVKQRKLKSALHGDWRKHYNHKASGLKGRVPISMANMQKQQDAINKIRSVLDKRQITLIADFKETLTNLKKLK